MDSRSGRAGMELTACEAGYLVDSIAPWPGQPDLVAGDTVVAIGRTMLLNLAPEEVEQRFGEAYCDGAIFVAGPYEELIKWPFDTVKHEAELLLTPSLEKPYDFGAVQDLLIIT